MDCAKANARRDEKHLNVDVVGCSSPYIRGLTVESILRQENKYSGTWCQLFANGGPSDCRNENPRCLQRRHSPHKGQWGGALMRSLIYASANGWANSRDAGDLRRRCVNCDVTLMVSIEIPLFSLCCCLLCCSHVSLQWRHNKPDDVSNHRRLGGLFNRLFNLIFPVSVRVHTLLVCSTSQTASHVSSTQMPNERLY